MNEISKIIHHHRRKASLTQKALADLAGVGKTAIFDIEKGKEGIRMETLFKVLKVLNISVQWESPLMKDYRERQK